MARGSFIAMEGLDGSGGTTQVKLLAQALRAGRPDGVVRTPHLTAEPSSGPVGKLIRQALGGHLPLGDGVLPYLFAADRKDHLEREIEPAVQRGEVVISDRYTPSSLAYQSLAAPMGFVATLNERFRNADLVVFLDLPPEQCLERILARGEALERFETLEKLQEISAGYGAALGLLSQSGAKVAHIDAHGSPEQVHERVLAAVTACLS